MTDRARQRAEFAARAGWNNAQVTPLAGDASARRYFRLAGAGGNAVLMDCPPEASGQIPPFLAIAGHLRGIGLSAPEIYATDAAAGLVLMEDLGDALFARTVRDNAKQEVPLYEVAVDALLQLHAQELPEGIDSYGPARMAEFIAPAFLHYRRNPESDGQFEAISAGLETVLNDVCPATDVLILRDYHAENLVWLPEREGVRRAGLLDFQDALAGHRAYDLVSLLQDARRDVSPACAEAMMRRYIARAGVDGAGFRAALAAQGAQRNIRILGIFARLARVERKRRYVDLVPRVWSHLLTNLEHPVMTPLRSQILAALPAPDAAHLAWLSRA